MIFCLPCLTDVPAGYKGPCSEMEDQISNTTMSLGQVSSRPTDGNSDIAVARHCECENATNTVVLIYKRGDDLRQVSACHVFHILKAEFHSCVFSGSACCSNCFSDGPASKEREP